MAHKLVIVESPAKAKTIKKFLGSGYQVIASNGHVRDLPKSQLGVDIEHDFEPKYITIRGKGELLAQLRKEVQKADQIYLATDPDREGEAISWHLYQALQLNEKKTSRITFHAITKDVVKGAIKSPREIDEHLVDAQQARRVLDRIVGYQISPILWKKVKKGLSAGRVQSAALHLLTRREEEIQDFVAEEFWTVSAIWQKSGASGSLETTLLSLDGEKTQLKTQDEAEAAVSRIRTADMSVGEIQHGKRRRKAPLPFTTSTLQQEASRRLNFTPAKTMQVAQQLYEGVDVQGHGTIGLITYLRTDSVRVADEAKAAALDEIENLYGKVYCGGTVENKTDRRIQDAHEAIRPTYADLGPDAVKGSLTRDQERLYKLIWSRFMASMMQPAEYETVKIKVEGDGIVMTASGSRLVFPGFLRAYSETEEEEPLDLIEGLETGDPLVLSEVSCEQHFTQPPDRYTEASLVREMEENGLGRPSTYAPTISTLQNRAYVTREKKALYVTELGTLVDQIMEEYFPEIVDVGFTAQMENELDQVEEGTLPWKQVIRTFYEGFEPEVKEANEKLEKVEIKDEVTDVVCEKCGRSMVLKMSRYGKFYACPGFPECRNTKPYLEYTGTHCPQCGSRVLIRRSRKGRVYYSCEQHPDCSFISWDKPSDERCPRCGEVLYIRGGRNPRFFCQKDGCGYTKPVQAQEEEKE